LFQSLWVTLPGSWFPAHPNRLACECQPTHLVASVHRQELSLPADTKYVKKVRDADDNPVYLFSVDIPELTIRFPYEGTYTVTCAYETADVVGSDGELPEINSAYHYAMAKYIAAKELEYTRPEKSNELLAQYYVEVDKANKSLSRGRTGRLILPGRRIF
jgi:hypothetical protein